MWRGSTWRLLRGLQWASSGERGVECWRSNVVRTDISQVVELQLQLAYFNVLLCELFFQPPELLLLTEEHAQELLRQEEGEMGV